MVDLSVYVERGWRGRGVGRALLQHLLPLAKTLGYHKLVLATFPYNAAGVADSAQKKGNCQILSARLPSGRH